jgi:hypothetical protein
MAVPRGKWRCKQLDGDKGLCKRGTCVLEQSAPFMRSRVLLLSTDEWLLIRSRSSSAVPHDLRQLRAAEARHPDSDPV